MWRASMNSRCHFQQYTSNLLSIRKIDCIHTIACKSCILFMNIINVLCKIFFNFISVVMTLNLLFIISVTSKNVSDSENVYTSCKIFNPYMFCKDRRSAKTGRRPMISVFNGTISNITCLKLMIIHTIYLLSFY